MLGLLSILLLSGWGFDHGAFDRGAFDLNPRQELVSFFYTFLYD